MNLNYFFNNKWFYRLLSLVFAIFLFGYVSSLGSGGSNPPSNNNTSMMSERSVTLKMPLNLNVNSDKYFVTGYPEKVKIKISGADSMMTAITNTRNFSVYADLSKLKPGTHRVKLQEAGLSRNLSYKISPATVKVKISVRKTADFPVQVVYNSDRLASGYQNGDSSANPQVVSVTGARADINKIDRVEALLDIPQGTDDTLVKQVMLQAVDNSGKILNVVISPETVRVKLPVYRATATKKVSLNFVASGGSSNQNYNFSSKTKEVSLEGTKRALSKLSQLTVSVPVSGVTSETTKTVKIAAPANGISTVTPSEVTVTITPSSVSTGKAASSTKSSSSSPSFSTAEQSSVESDNSSVSSSSAIDNSTSSVSTTTTSSSEKSVTSDTTSKDNKSN
ncbi:MAG: CdaR family protein [Liquorilactobacillus ghanensis]|uniref:CdaR family protein n=1 Tax=Liquorilactobacillus ghanensis TaxID=399370 RepID=UPI0039EB5A26